MSSDHSPDQELLTENMETAASLLNSTKAILSSSRFDAAARLVFQEACRMTGATSGYVALFGEDGTENEVFFLEGGGVSCSVDPSLPVPISGLRGVVCREKRVVFENDFASSEWAKHMPEGHVNLTNVMFAPLVYEGRVHGVIGLANKPQDFTPSDARLAATFAEFAAVSLRHNRTLDKLQDTIHQLKKALREVKTLKGLIPICFHCKKVRDEEGYWHQVEAYITEHSEAVFSHALCAECLAEHYPEHADE